MKWLARCLLVAALSGCGQAPPATNDAGLPDVAVAVPDLATLPDLIPPITGPTLLSQTGLYTDIGGKTLAPGLFTYTPRYELWSDGAEKSRFLLLPQGAKIDNSDMDNWVFPVGTKMWKEFRVGGRRIETRLLHKQIAGWWKVAYVWSADESEATAAPNGAPNAVGTSHDVPAQMDCEECHRRVSDVLIGVSAIQLSSANGNGALSKLVAMGVLSNPPVGEFQPPGLGVVQDALGYLHGNCGHCHNGSLPPPVRLSMRLNVADATPQGTATYFTAINKKAQHVLNGDALIVVPKRPDQSQLYYRMGLRDILSMPPVCTKVADQTGLMTINAWINGLP